MSRKPMPTPTPVPVNPLVLWARLVSTSEHPDDKVALSFANEQGLAQVTYGDIRAFAAQ